MSDEKTRLSKELIPDELVGQSASIQDSSYEDDYLSRINQEYPWTL